MALPPNTKPVLSDDEAPPFLGSWRNVYIAVVAYLLSLIILFSLFRKTFEP